MRAATRKLAFVAVSLVLLGAGCSSGGGSAGATPSGGSGGGAGAGAQGTNGDATGGGGSAVATGAGGAGAGGADAGGAADVAGGAGGMAVVDAAASDVPRTACEQVVAMVDRSCAADTDCIAVSHQTDVMGQMRVVGIRASAMARFADLEKTCQPTKKGFSLPATTADDGSLISGMVRPVACQGAVCTTYAPPCGHPCAPGHICITCGNGAAAQSVCSQDCRMGPCTEPPRTQCLGGASLNGGEGDFCFDPMFNAGFMSSSCHR